MAIRPDTAGVTTTITPINVVVRKVLNPVALPGGAVQQQAILLHIVGAGPVRSRNAAVRQQPQQRERAATIPAAEKEAEAEAEEDAEVAGASTPSSNPDRVRTAAARITEQG